MASQQYLKLVYNSARRFDVVVVLANRHGFGTVQFIIDLAPSPHSFTIKELFQVTERGTILSFASPALEHLVVTRI